MGRRGVLLPAVRLAPLRQRLRKPAWPGHGPVVLVIDALCYSTTDTFAAGLQDHEIGSVLGCNATTGAGEANVVPQDLLRERLGDGDRL